MNKLRIVMTIIIFLCIVFYHFSHLLVTKTLDCFSVSGLFYEFKTLWTLASIVIFCIFVFMTLKWNWLTERLIGCDYIAGQYSGTSTESDNKDRQDHIEEFKIRQNLLSTTISGISKTQDRKFLTNWEGHFLYHKNKTEGMKSDTWVFYVSMQTEKITEHGILTLAFKGDVVFGFYESCNPKMQFVSKLTAKKIS